MNTEPFYPSKAKFSLFGSRKSQSRTCTLGKVYDIIVNDKNTETSTRHLYSITVSGVFKYSDDTVPVKHSGLIMIAIDHIADIQKVKQTFIEDEFLTPLLMFESTDARGLRVVLHAQVSAQYSHEQWYRATDNYILSTYNLGVDHNCINVNKPCFLPHDSGCYIHPSAKSDSKIPLPVKKNFDISFWSRSVKAETKPSCTYATDIQTIARRAIEQQADITGNYITWRNIGNILADVFNEEGEELFSSLSKLNTEKYNEEECSKQWHACLKTDENRTLRVMPRTFFYYAEKAGVDVKLHKSVKCNSCKTEMEQPGYDALSVSDIIRRSEFQTFCDKISGICPADLQRIIDLDSDLAIKDMLAFSSIVCYSAVMPNVYGIYDGRKMYANLYGFYVAPPGNSKGKITLCEGLVNPVDAFIRTQYREKLQKYREALALYNSKNRPEAMPMPVEPPFCSLFLAGNSSATALLQMLCNNGGWGLMLETEADTVTYSLKSDYGNFSDALRKISQHEKITYNRRKDNEHVEIARPRLSVMLSGTPEQVPALIPSTANGLFSRFLFMVNKRELKFRNVFARHEKTLDEQFEKLGNEYYPLFRQLYNLEKPVEFTLTEHQQEHFLRFYDEELKEDASLHGDNFAASVLRNGLSCFRIAMVLSVLRLKDNSTTNIKIPGRLVCTDNDFNCAMIMSDTLMQHTLWVNNNLMPRNEELMVTGLHISGKKLEFLKALPDEFTTQTSYQTGRSLGMKKRLCIDYTSMLLRCGVIKRTQHGHYQKVHGSEEKDE